MRSEEELFASSDTSVINVKIKFDPVAPEIQRIYTSNCNAKTYEDVLNEALGLAKRDDEWLMRNIRESMKKNADIWSELAKY